MTSQLDKEWEDRVRLIMEEEDGECPTPPPEATVAVDADTQAQTLERIDLLERNGVRVPIKTKAKALGFKATVDNTLRLPISNIKFNLDVDPSFWNRNAVDLSTMSQTTINKLGIPPGVIYEFSVSAEYTNRPITSPGEITPGMSARLQFQCGDCRQCMEKAIASWQLANTAPMVTNKDTLYPLMQRFADVGCRGCQRTRIAVAQERVTVTIGVDSIYDGDLVEVQHYCPVCGTDFLQELPLNPAIPRREDQIQAVKQTVRQTIVCLKCSPFVDPDIYKKGKGLLR